MSADRTEPLDVLAVMAHPDDAELLCGGALIRSADAGERVGVLDLSAGEMGSSGSAELRADEAARAAEIMGLTVRRCAGLPDSRLANDEASRRVVIEALRTLRPRVVVTHWKVGRHRDHRVASALVRDACYLAGLTKLDADGAPFRPHKLVYASAYREDVGPPDIVVDVTDQMERKLEAMAAYASQFVDVTAMGEAFAGGDRPLLDQVRAHLGHYGSRIRVAYGEPFHLDEAVAVTTLGSLQVASF